MSSASTGACISSAAMSSALSRTFSAATRVADAVITVAREACAPMPCSMRSVWPWITRIFFIVGAEHLGRDLRHHRLEALPDRRAAGDDLDRAGGVDLDAHAVGRAEARLLDEHGEADADHLAVARGARASSALSSVPVDVVQHLCRAARGSRRNRNGFPRPAPRAAA